MAAGLTSLRLPFDAIDIEQDSALEAAYGESIPVLLEGDRELARAPQTRKSLKEALQRAGVM
jgi:hypothetical protein